ncbi:MAG: hypothetical protein C4551_10200 [Bacillota bacterium]|jgi:hypothetical protein|nr:MAG: hypothetical protein C4551_10200 [Bacillota bacterium]
MLRTLWTRLLRRSRPRAYFLRTLDHPSAGGRKLPDGEAIYQLQLQLEGGDLLFLSFGRVGYEHLQTLFATMARKEALAEAQRLLREGK